MVCSVVFVAACVARFYLTDGAPAFYSTLRKGPAMEATLFAPTPPEDHTGLWIALFIIAAAAIGIIWSAG